MPKISNSSNFTPFSEIMIFPATETIGNLTVDRESLHTHNYIDNFELPISPNHAIDTPSSSGYSDSSQDGDMTSDVQADVSSRKDVCSS